MFNKVVTTVLLMMAEGPLSPAISDERAAVYADEASDKSAFRMVEGQHLYVRLSGNLGTGYAWQIVSMAAVLKLVDKQIERSDAGKPGAAQLQVFDFEAARKGEADLVIQYCRPWIPNGKHTKSFTVSIMVD